MEGYQLIKMQGYLKKPKLMTVGPYDSSLFLGTIAIPANDMEDKYQYLQVSSFTCADDLGELVSGTPLYIEGHLEVKVSTAACSNCGENRTQYWTNIIIDRFELM